MTFDPTWIVPSIALGTILVNLGINIATLAAVRREVDRLANSHNIHNEKLFNHDARIAVLEAGLRTGR